MRFYVHYEVAEPVYTLAVEWPASRSSLVAELCTQFATAFNHANPAAKPLQDAASRGSTLCEGSAAWLWHGVTGRRCTCAQA